MLNNRYFIPGLTGAALGAGAGALLGMTGKGIVLFGGWALVAVSTVALAIYRLTLIRDDRRARAVGASKLHFWIVRQESEVDRLGIPLTAASIFYTAVLVCFTASLLIDAAIRKALTLFALR